MGKEGFSRRILDWMDQVVSKYPEQERQSVRAVLYSIPVGIFYHLVMLIVFAVIGVHQMAIFNCFSVVWWSFCLLIGSRYKGYNRFRVLGLVGNIEIILHMAAAVYFVGMEAGFQLLLLNLLSTTFLLPAEQRKPTYVFLVLIPAVWISLWVYMKTHVPVYTLADPILVSFFVFNLFSILSMLIFDSGYLVVLTASALKTADYERKRADRLLLNILPEPIAERLKAEELTIADSFTDASIFFCDIVNFTVMSSGKPPEEVVDILNELFSRIDGLLDEYSMEKIKTIGDAYMAVCGIPEPVEDHAFKAVSFAEAVQERLSQFNREKGLTMQLRYGVNSGPVVAGVIGKRKFIYDLWGETVNTASRMESYGLPGRIQITPATKERLNGKCIYESRGEIEIKGIGMMETFLVSTV